MEMVLRARNSHLENVLCFVTLLGGYGAGEGSRVPLFPHPAGVHPTAARTDPGGDVPHRDGKALGAA